MEEWLVVDGYNIIGAWPELQRLKKFNLAAARDRLIELLSEYAVYSGRRVILVFDAHLVPGQGVRKMTKGCAVIFTKKEETADECIERLVGELKRPHRRQLFVATSDYTEQRITFGRGALRISARELLNIINHSHSDVSAQLKTLKAEKRTLGQGLSAKVRQQLEQWRRQ